MNNSEFEKDFQKGRYVTYASVIIITIECLRNEKKNISVDFSMDFLESKEIIFNPWIEYPWIAVYFIDPWIKFRYK